ncbi:hypothetical protein MIND_00082000 [Mycena indigotica]|uniref:F-box domain-containing protein n=1 Tax=Mycena indigotica TaxID=2126181 RepID=A0A8H6TE83_9AGAR|nr:uncharacterized protein MIND_00082000 [Mycena indigotica]KAF7315664.1 hypothetical protein MIND_00082000 [Mycena indigotica]
MTSNLNNANSTPSSRAEDRALIAEIHQQQASITQLIQKLRDKTREISQTLDAASPFPFHQLPPELMASIFTNCLPTYPFCAEMVGRKSPAKFMLVCRRWRDIALSTPQLWRAMDIGSINSRYVSQLSLVSLWLQHSKSMPLSIDADSFTHIEEDTMKALFAHKERWEFVRFQLDMAKYPGLKDTTPLLRSLELNTDSYLPSSQGIDVSFLPRDVPRLRAVILWDFWMPSHFEGTATFFPWSQLTALILLYPHVSNCNEILQHTKQLIHFELIMSSSSPEGPESNILLPDLQSLVFARYGSDPDEQSETTHYISTLVLPALRKIRVCDIMIRPNPVAALKALVERSGCKLEEVCITGGRSGAKEIYERELGTYVWFDESHVGTEGWIEEDEQARARQRIADIILDMG